MNRWNPTFSEIHTLSGTQNIQSLPRLFGFSWNTHCNLQIIYAVESKVDTVSGKHPAVFLKMHKRHVLKMAKIQNIDLVRLVSSPPATQHDSREKKKNPANQIARPLSFYPCFAWHIMADQAEYVFLVSFFKVLKQGNNNFFLDRFFCSSAGEPWDNGECISIRKMKKIRLK